MGHPAAPAIFRVAFRTRLAGLPRSSETCAPKSLRHRCHLFATANGTDSFCGHVGLDENYTGGLTFLSIQEKKMPHSVPEMPLEPYLEPS